MNRMYDREEMDGLEKLVPPLELCKQIPAGEFADSALVWMHRTALDGIASDPFCVTNRMQAEHYKREMHPAPTLAEILLELPLVLTEVSSTQTVDRKYCRTLIQTIAPLTSNDLEWEELDKNAATAALRLWLRINAKGENK